ncbi:MAG TPA: NUDIX domain-containing protein [Dongiaceae bacterium]|nr:NUDIX domain-containing protein [Dongiaceae bacterium]
MTSSIVRPTDAAGLVLLRGSRSDPEVLLGRRHARAGFLPDIYVFPGGRVETEDARGEPVSLPPQVAAGLAWATRRPAAAFVRAALRETAEETGLTLPPETVRHIDFVCRAITPTFSRRRYNTRFLLADGVHCRGVLAGDGELVDLGWHRYSAVGKLKLVDVTTFVLEEAVRRWRLGVAPGAEPVVRFSYAGGKVRIFRRPALP